MQVLILTNIQNIYIVNMPTALQEIQHIHTHKHTNIQMGKQIQKSMLFPSVTLPSEMENLSSRVITKM